MAKPTVLFASIEYPGDQGDDVSNGGVKLQSVWQKLLREHGHEAYRITWDGTQLPWLIDPQPVISFKEARKLARLSKPLRVMTTWIVSRPVLELVDRPYYFDAELGHTAYGEHLIQFGRWLPNLAKVGTHSRTQQAWFMANFGFVPTYIQEWSDTELFKPAPEKRKKGLIGWMYEGPHSEGQIDYFQSYCDRAGLDVEFKRVGGTEQEVITSMQECDIFLGMNIGKHPMYGEGCPRSPQESIHCGAVVIAYDVFGNREYLFDGYTGFLVKCNDQHAMAKILVSVLQDEPLKETVRRQGEHYVKHMFAPTKRRYLEIKEFLDL